MLVIKDRLLLWQRVFGRLEALFIIQHMHLTLVLDTPKSGVVRKVDVDLANSTLPYIVKSQRGDDGAFAYGGAHIQSISVSTDFGQENIQELGRFGPYHRFATFPIEVTCEFEVIATSGDLVNVSGNAPNLSNETIIVKDLSWYSS